MSSSSFFPPSDGDKELQLVNYLENLPQELVNEILSRLSLSEIILLWRTNTTMQRLINEDADLMLELGVKSFDYFLNELNALMDSDWRIGFSGSTANLEPGLRLDWVLKKKILLSTAKCLFLAPEKRMLEIMGSEAAVANLKIFLEANHLTMAKAIAIFSNDWLVILLAEKAITIEQAYNIFIENIKTGDNRSNASKLISCEFGAKALLEKLITLSDVAQIDDDSFVYYFESQAAGLVGLRKRYQFLTNKNHWKMAGAENQEDFDERFYKLPMRWQFVVALSVPLGSVESVILNLDTVKANINDFVDNFFLSLKNKELLRNPRRKSLGVIKGYFDQYPALLIKFSGEMPDKEELLSAIYLAHSRTIQCIFDAEICAAEVYHSKDLVRLIEHADEFEMKRYYLEPNFHAQTFSDLIKNLPNLGKENDISLEVALTNFSKLPFKYQVNILKERYSLAQAQELHLRINQLSPEYNVLLTSSPIEVQLKFLATKPEELPQFLEDLSHANCLKALEKASVHLKQTNPTWSPPGAKK